MTKMGLCVLLLANISITGCTSLNSGVKDVNCTGVYNTRNLTSEMVQYSVKVKKIRIDKNETITIRPENSLDLHFFPGFKEKDLLTGYKCLGEDYGLRSPAIRR